eukprot:scaffold226016_cov44-Tisochrysis_lutea.AAC.1
MMCLHARTAGMDRTRRSCPIKSPTHIGAHTPHTRLHNRTILKPDRRNRLKQHVDHCLLVASDLRDGRRTAVDGDFA